MDNRNDQQNRPGMGQGQNSNQSAGDVDQNPQEGGQWDNYQTRELSNEGGAKIQEGDLLQADEASKQQPVHREDNG